MNTRRGRISVAIFLLSALALALAFPRLAGAFYSNLGNIELGRALVHGDIQGLQNARALFQQALDWDETNERANSKLRDYLQTDSQIRLYQRMLKARPTSDAVYRALITDIAELQNEQVTRDPSNVRFHFLLGKYELEAGNREKAISQFRYVVDKSSPTDPGPQELAESYYNLGEYYDTDGNDEKAVEAFEKTLLYNKNLVPAYQRLSALYQKLNRIDALARLNEQMAGLEPKYRVKSQLSEDWFLEGYDLDEVALEMDTRVTMYLFWTAAPGISVEGLGLAPFGKRWVQTKSTSNLVTNGSFEAGIDRATGLPYGFSRVYNQRSQQFNAVGDSRDGRTTTVATAENPVPDGAGLSAVNITVEPGSLYLEAGWMRTDDGLTGLLGHLWVGNPKLERPYNFIAGLVSPSWIHNAAVLKAPPGSSEIQLWIVNRNGVGRVYFDDLLLVRLDIPTYALETASRHKTLSPETK